ncbi:kinase-like domain-containing protein [Suillus subluteus]|nr:kinase-like domain-containing protein [Suillus subluteus]
MDPGFVPEVNTVVDLTPLISKLESPITLGSFSQVYRCTIGASKGTMEVAVKVIIIDYNRAMPKLERAMDRGFRLWFRLRHLNIVPLLGIARVESPWPALVYPWMPSGTLYIYLEKQATTLSVSTKFGLIKGIADGLYYLHSNNVVHGDLQPANVLIDNSGNPCLTGFGFATILGDPELQWNSTTAACDFNSRWRAPEVIGIESDEPARPTFASDIYSFGSIMFFIISGNIPWKEKKNLTHIVIELSRGATPARPENMPNSSWNLIKRCWSLDPMDRPETAHLLDYTYQCRIDDSQESVSELTTLSIPRSLAGPVDLTGQIFGTVGGYVAGGTFGNVYRCEWRQPYGPTVEVAVKALRFHTSEQDLRRFRRESTIWAHLVHDNIVTLVGTTEGFGPTTALVSPWFPDGNLLHMIAAQGAGLSIRSKLKLLHGIASGLDYLHRFPVVHGGITSSNVLVGVKDGEYKACLTDFGLSTVLGGFDFSNEESKIRHGAIRWTAPELLTPHDHSADTKPTTKHDMYSFGRVMFHVLSLVIPWHDIDEYEVLQKIQKGEDIPRPEVSEATTDVTGARWNHIEQCWSIDPSARPSAFTTMNFIKGELEALIQDDVPVGGLQESHQSTHSGVVNAEQINVSVPLNCGVQRQVNNASLWLS